MRPRRRPQRPRRRPQRPRRRPCGPVAAPSGPVAAPIGPVAAPIGPVAASSGPVAAPSDPVAAPSGPVDALRGPSRPLCGPVAPPSGPVAARIGPVAAPSGPVAAPVGPVAAPSGPVTALHGPFSCQAAEPPSRRAAQPPSRPAVAPPGSRVAQQPSRQAAEPANSRAAQQPSRPTAEPPSSRAAQQPSRPAAEPPSNRAAQLPSRRAAVEPLLFLPARTGPSHPDWADRLSLFDLTSGASPAPPATADSTIRSQWATRDAAARLAVRRHLPTAERAHFSLYKSAKTLYDVVVARYSSPATAALSRLMLPYLFPDLAAFPTVTDLITHLRTSDTRYRAALPAEFCAKNPPPMYITLYYIVTRLPDSLRLVWDHFLSVCPTTLTVDLLEERLLAAEKSIVAVGASRGDPRTPVFEGCSPSPLLPSVASATAADLVGFESRGGGTGPCTYVLHTGDRAGEQCGGLHSTQRCFGRLTTAWRHQFPDATEIPHWGELSRAGIAIFDLYYDAILAAMYAVSTSDEGDCYLCVPPDPGIEAAALGAGEAAALGASASAAPGAGESALSGTTSAQALHTFTLDSGASRSFFRDRTTLTPLSPLREAPLTSHG
ncbi:unnamed protein product [Closterium sp. NIES-65]|nr:unnamed protein product [Closterium sp. NIES-65]